MSQKARNKSEAVTYSGTNTTNNSSKVVVTDETATRSSSLSLTQQLGPGQMSVTGAPPVQDLSGTENGSRPAPHTIITTHLSHQKDELLSSTATPPTETSFPGQIITEDPKQYNDSNLPLYNVFHAREQPEITTAQATGGSDYIVSESNSGTNLLQVTEPLQDNSQKDVHPKTDEGLQMATALARMYGISLEEAMVMLNIPDSGSNGKPTYSPVASTESTYSSFESFQNDHAQDASMLSHSRNGMESQIRSPQSTFYDTLSFMGSSPFTTPQQGPDLTAVQSSGQHDFHETYNISLSQATESVWKPLYLSSVQNSSELEPATVVWSSGAPRPSATSTNHKAPYLTFPGSIQKTTPPENTAQDNRQETPGTNHAQPNIDTPFSQKAFQLHNLPTATSSEKQYISAQEKLKLTLFNSFLSKTEHDISNKTNHDKETKLNDKMDILDFDRSTTKWPKNKTLYSPPADNLNNIKTRPQNETFMESSTYTYNNNQITNSVNGTASDKAESEMGGTNSAANTNYSKMGVVNLFSSPSLGYQTTPPSQNGSENLFFSPNAPRSTPLPTNTSRENYMSSFPTELTTATDGKVKSSYVSCF